MTRITRIRWASSVLAGGLALVPLAGCSNSATGGASGVTASASTSGGAASGSVGGSVSASASGSPSVAGVNCSGTTCTVTLNNSNAKVTVLGTTLSLDSVSGGKATLTAGDKSVSCSQGDSTSAGPLKLECTTVTSDSVTLTASLG